MKFATTALVAFFKGMASTHFVKYSMATRIHTWPLEGGFIGPINQVPKCGKVTVLLYLAARLDEYELHLQVFGMHDTS